MIKIILSRTLGERRLKQADLQRATGIRPSTIGDWYNMICEALDCDISDLLVRIPNQKPKAKKAERRSEK